MVSECESCIHHLLDDMDVLDEDMDKVRDGLATVSIGVEAMKRLERANQSVAAMEVNWLHPKSCST